MISRDRLSVILQGCISDMDIPQHAAIMIAFGFVDGVTQDEEILDFLLAGMRKESELNGNIRRLSAQLLTIIAKADNANN